MFVWQNKEGLWCEFPDLEGCMTDGDTLEELVRNASDALESWLSSCMEHKEKLPKASGIKELKKKADKSKDPVDFIVPVTGYLPDKTIRINVTSTANKIDEITCFAKKIGKTRSE